MTDKHHSDTQEKVESIQYRHAVPTTGGLEGATNSITATSEASGTGNADYSQAVTLPIPDDPRLVILKVVARLAVTIDSMTAGHLYCRVYVDAQDADHRFLDTDWTTSGAKLDVLEQSSGTIFDLLSDGASHTFYFFLWVDSGDAVVSALQLWEAVGQRGATQAATPAFRLDFEGEVTTAIRVYGVGSGTPYGYILGDFPGDVNINLAMVTGMSGIIGHTMVWKNNKICFRSTVDTDITFAYQIILNLRRPQ